MKIQCSCGTKYEFEVTPEQAQQRVSFVCQKCGLDASEYVTQLVRQQFGLTDAPPPAEIAPAPGATPGPAAAALPVPPPPPMAAPAPRLHRGGVKPADEAVAQPDPHFCAKHAGVPATEHCVVCHRPICPQCMSLFGYVCSPLCRQKADLKGIHVPVFAGQKSVVEARRWRLIGWSAGTVVVLVVGLVAFRIWYRLVGSSPKVVFAQKFDQAATSGDSYLCGPDLNQVVVLHGATLARIDTKQKQRVWSVELVKLKDFEAERDKEMKEFEAAQIKRNDTNPDAGPMHIPSPDKLLKSLFDAATSEYELRVVGQNIWVANPKQVARYDWDTGKAVAELPVKGGFGGLIERGDELLRLDHQPEKDVITHINLATGKIRDEDVLQPQAAAITAARAKAEAAALAGTTPGKKKPQSGAGLPIGKPGVDRNKALDPGKVQAQASQLSLPEQLALPAVLSGNRAQERALAELEGEVRNYPTKDVEGKPLSYYTLIPARDGYVQFTTRMVEEHLVAKEAMKARPGKSALDGPVSVTATREVANEILNDIQRDRGGSTVTVDESKYAVTLRRADGKGADEWQGEVIGPPSIYPLNSVNVVACKQKIIVLSKENKKLWESALNYDVVGTAREGDPHTTGQGPCVERGNTLFVFDQGVLTAFDLKTGNAQWRLPSVGITGLFFDEEGMMYVDSTTASPDTIKYSKQIDISAKNMGLIMKINPHNGKTLWAQEIGGGLAYVGGKYIYTTQISGGVDEDAEERPHTMLEGGPRVVRIRRINLSNGKPSWEYFEDRVPIEVHFDQNQIHLLFVREVELLKCGTF